MHKSTLHEAWHPCLRTLGVALGALLLGTFVSPNAQSFDAPNVQVQEGDYAAFKVKLSTPLSVPIRWQYGTQDGTATSPADYTQASGRLTIAAGTTEGEINVLTVNDGATDSGETFTLRLSNLQVKQSSGWTSTGSMGNIPRAKTITATINDN